MQEERRKSKRMELDSTLVIKRLDDGSEEEISIVIDDVSKTGVGFHCDTPLMIGTVYESFLQIWTKEVLHAFLEIVRIEKINSRESVITEIKSLKKTADNSKIKKPKGINITSLVS